MKPLNKPILDSMVAAGCQDPECNHQHHKGQPLFLMQKCHAGAGLEVSYDLATGLLNARCRICRETIADIEPQDIPVPFWKLNQWLSEEVIRVERLEDAGKATPADYRALAHAEDQVAYHTHPNSVEGRIARCGALRAILKSGDTSIAARLYDVYCLDPKANKQLRDELEEVKRNATKL